MIRWLFMFTRLYTLYKRDQQRYKIIIFYTIDNIIKNQTMRFSITLRVKDGILLLINYQYPLSAALYRIISKGDANYAQFLHEKGYGKKDKGFKLCAFSQL